MTTSTLPGCPRHASDTAHSHPGTTIDWPFFLILGITTLYRGLVLMYHELPLYVDEAYYWTWAQQLDWGYYSKPPLLAALIALTTSVSDSEFAIRSGALLLHPLTCLLIYCSSMALTRHRPTSRLAALLYILMPAVSVSSMVISTDALLLLFWAMALYALVKAVHSGQTLPWIICGIATGFGLLSKYTMAAFFLSALLTLAMDPVWRRQLLTPKPYLALLISLAIFAPNLLWNLSHGFPTLQHTAEIARAGEFQFNVAEIGEFIGGQFLVFGPISFAILLSLLPGRCGWRDRQSRLLLAFCVPLLLMVCFQALSSRANANWAAPAYVAAAILVAWRLSHIQPIWWKSAVAANLTLMLVLYHYPLIASAAKLETSASDPFKRQRGWPEFGSRVSTLMQSTRATHLVSSERDTLSYAQYYGGLDSSRLLSLPLRAAPRHQFDLSHPLPASTPSDEQWLLLTRHISEASLQHSFSKITALGTLKIQTHPDAAIEYRVYKVRR